MVVNNRIWVGVSVVLMIAIILMGWFLGISPRLGEMAANAVQLQGIEAQNKTYEAELARLKAENEKLPEYEKELLKLQRSLPYENDLSTFLGIVHQLDVKSGVLLINFGAVDAVPFTQDPGAAELPHPEFVAQSVDPEEFVAIEVSMTVRGSQAGVLDFVNLLQLHERRFLVTGLNIITEDKGATYNGTVTGYLYVLIDPSRPVGEKEEVDEEEPEPAPSASPTPSSSPSPSSSPTATNP